MYAVALSLGVSKAVVSVAPLPSATAVPSSSARAPIQVVANSTGHRGTPVVAALTPSEILFGDNARQYYARQPQRVVPHLFALTAATQVDGSVGRSPGEEAAPSMLADVLRSAGAKYGGHAPLVRQEDGDETAESTGGRLGFRYEREALDGTAEESFLAAEDLFVLFLNHVKEHTIDGPCGLVVGAGDATSNPSRPLLLTLVVPRYAFPGGTSTTWLERAVHASHLGGVVQHVSVLFSDEAALLAMDSAAGGAETGYFLLPPGAAADVAGGVPFPEANVLVVDGGAQGLALSLLRTRGGMLLRSEGGPSYVAPTRFGTSAGGDAMDAALADLVAVNYILRHRRLFEAGAPSVAVLQRLLSPHHLQGGAERRQVVADCLSSRSMRRLRLLMEEKKAALNTHPQAMSVAVEVEAFFEGVDLLDNQSLSRHRFELAVRSEWDVPGAVEKALGDLVAQEADRRAEGPIHAVVLVGGSCAIPVVAQAIRRGLAAHAGLAGRLTPSMRLLDASSVGHGVAPDEVVSVGGCLHSYAMALLARAAAGRPPRGSSAKGRRQEAWRREQEEARAGAWAAVTRLREAERGGTAAVAVDFLRPALYLYTSARLDALRALERVGTIAQDDLTLLFPAGTPLPARRAFACPSPPLLLYLLSEGAGETACEAGPVRRVRPAMAQPLEFTLPATSTESVFLVLTAQAEAGEGTERVVRLTAQVVRGADGALPRLLTPGDTLGTATGVLN